MTVPTATRSQQWQVLRRSATFWVGGGITLMWIFFALFGDFVTPFDPQGAPQDVLNRLDAPSTEHWFGTDELGRDVLSRVIVGARQVLTVVLALAALGPNTIGVIIVIGLVFTPLIAKTVRAAVLTERQHDYITAAQLRRENSLYIMFVEILPNVSSVIIVEFTVRLGYAIFTVLALAFLGFGVEPDIPDWGLAISQHYSYLTGDVWWPVLFPALAIASLVVGVNLLADAISQALE
jgi:peptide/nickel transport system permease protein